MSNLFHKVYRVTSTRLPNWDYSSTGYYYVTICTYKKKEYFGKIIDNKIELSDIGEIANTYWQEIPHHFTFVKLDEYIIMPNHVHGIVIIKNTCNIVGKNVCRDVINHVSTYNNYSKITPMGKHGLGEIIRWFKGKTTYEIRKVGYNFFWQSRYYDHIIRNEREYYMIRQYVKDNLMNWRKDEEYNDSSFNNNETP